MLLSIGTGCKHELLPVGAGCRQRMGRATAGTSLNLRSVCHEEAARGRSFWTGTGAACNVPELQETRQGAFSRGTIPCTNIYQKPPVCLPSPRQQAGHGG